MKETSKIIAYRSLSILNGMSKIYERYIHNSLFSYAVTILIIDIFIIQKLYGFH